MGKIRITVLSRLDPKHIFGENIPINPRTGKKWELCSKFNDGQEFFVEEDEKMPEGFCSWAWHDLYKDLSVLKYGGNFPWAKKGESITCCTDGIRPVSFKLERIQ
ncbi:TIGR04076 family protein [Candidatus Bathyarchaeota archaeon]|nr:TIGR04076 family protein [Candidatus Bathyarchaeota archaeon]